MPSVALAHDYLTQRGGAERVVLTLHKLFPHAPIYTTLYDPEGTYPEFRTADIRVTPLNRISFLRHRHRFALPFLASASSRVRIKEDIAIISTSGWAHGFQTQGQRIIYCHSPARWLWVPEDYFGGGTRSRVQQSLARPLLGALRKWDYRAAHQGGTVFANSSVIVERIHQAWNLDSELLFPPVMIDVDGPQEPIPSLSTWMGYNLVVSRLMRYKHVNEVVEALRGMPGERGVIVGDGPLWDELAPNLPANVRMVRGISEAQLRWVYAHCARLIAASHEDFGLTPIEANAYGKPVVALQRGGYLDTVLPGVTGVFFNRPEPKLIRTAIEHAASFTWNPDKITAHAAKFSVEEFARRIKAAIA